MTSSHFTSEPVLPPVSLSKRMLQGAIPALILVLLFLSGSGEPKPEWGPYWLFRPLVIVPLAGACGGALYHYLGSWRDRGTAMKWLALGINLIVYLVAIWLGFVAGFHGTYWH